jgi:hypothetical protein
MKETKLHQKIIIPLFNVKLEEPVHLSIAKEQCVNILTLNIFPEPIRIIPGKPIDNKPDNPPIKIPLPPPEIAIHFYPWKIKKNMANEINDILTIEQLPADFDTFDNLGTFAMRPGPGGTGGFQTITNLHTIQNATALLIIEFDKYILKISPHP